MVNRKLILHKNKTRAGKLNRNQLSANKWKILEQNNIKPIVKLINEDQFLQTQKNSENSCCAAKSFNFYTNYNDVGHQLLLVYIIINVFKNVNLFYSISFDIYTTQIVSDFDKYCF